MWGQVLTLDGWCDDIVRHVVYRQPVMGVADLAMQNDDSSFLFVTCFSHRLWGGRQNKRKTIHIKADKHETSEAGQYLPHPKFTEQTHTGDCSIFRIFTYSDSHSIISCWSWWWCDFWSRITVHFVVVNCTRKEAIARSIQWDIHSKLLGGVCWNLLNMLNIQWIKNGAHGKAIQIVQIKQCWPGDWGFFHLLYPPHFLWPHVQASTTSAQQIMV